MFTCFVCPALSRSIALLSFLPPLALTQDMFNFVLQATGTDANTDLTYVTPGSATVDPLTFTSAVTGINVLRDSLGGTSGASVEQPLFRSVTDVGTYSATTGLELFVADSTGDAYGRTPTQVRCLACLEVSYQLHQNCNLYVNGLHAAAWCQACGVVLRV